MRLESPGFTLIEILVATAIAGAVGAAMTTTLVRQQRFYSAAAQELGIRSQLRDGAGVMVADIRSAAVAGYGLSSMTDSSIEMFTTIGTSVACGAAIGNVVGLPPSTLTTGHTLTSFLVQPDTGDIATVYEMPSGVPDSGRWTKYRVASFGSRATTSTCPASTGFTTAADATSAAYSLTLVQAPGPSLRSGAPIHFLRRVRYSLYRSSDNSWYLGYRRCNVLPPGCGAIQPVSGPYRAYSVSGEGGLSFRYFNSSGIAINANTSADVGRVEIVLRAETGQPVALVGDAATRYRDSAVASISPRNRR